MMIGRVTKVTDAEVTADLIGSGSYSVLATHWPAGGVSVGDKVALDELKAAPGEHVIVAWLAD